MGQQVRPRDESVVCHPVEFFLSIELVEQTQSVARTPQNVVFLLIRFELINEIRLSVQINYSAKVRVAKDIISLKSRIF